MKMNVAKVEAEIKRSRDEDRSIWPKDTSMGDLGGMFEVLDSLSSLNVVPELLGWAILFDRMVVCNYPRCCQQGR